MNNFHAAELLKGFPYELARHPGYLPDRQEPLETVDDYKDSEKASHLAMLAAIVAEELEDLSADHDLLALYGRIDELDETMLDILAWDFKIDWWDGNAPLEKKRELFKTHFIIHRQLGSIGAVETAITSRYNGAKVTEWPEYGGQPYHFRIDVDLGEIFGSGEILDDLLYRARFYLNVRSVLDGVTFMTERKKQLFYGLAALYGYRERLKLCPERMEYLLLADEEGVLLTDEDDDLLAVDAGYLFPLRQWQQLFHGVALCIGRAYMAGVAPVIEETLQSFYGCALVYGVKTTLRIANGAVVGEAEVDSAII